MITYVVRKNTEQKGQVKSYNTSKDADKIIYDDLEIAA
jgi:hypothetical protein